MANQDTVATRILPWLVGIQTSIMVAGISWAYSMSVKLATLETKLSVMAPGDLLERVVRLETVNEIRNQGAD